jgi:hypothetical protein
MIARAAVQLLEQAIGSPLSLMENIAAYQRLVLDADTLETSEAAEELLRDLAQDLDYFEPDPAMRAEDQSFFGPEKAIEEIRQALRKLKEIETQFS